MIKKLFIVLTVLICACISRSIFAISSDFKFVIDTIGIPQYNTYGDEINEDVYYAYNVFSYGKPHKVKDVNQRWKDSKYGYWTKNGGKYNGMGTRGEYNILGRSYSGALIYNYYFPMDVIPSTTPDKWVFCSYPGAKESWKDTTKYKYKEQLEYMKTKKLMFNDVSSRDKADNPKYIKEYNITANSIGLSKARLDVAATWKTNGMVSTRRNINGVIYSQVYLVKPMAASADIKTTINVDKSVILKETEDEIAIPIEYKSDIINMSGYAKESHIKEIKSELYINGNKVDEISGSKIISKGSEFMLIISRDDYPPNQTYSFEIKNKGYMHTEFVVDGLMQSETTTTIELYVEPKLTIPVENKEVRLLEKETQKWVVRPLTQTSITSTANSVGFTEAGKYVIVKLKLNVKSENIKNVQVHIDNKKIEKIQLYDVKDNLGISFKIPENTSATLYGQYSLRKKEDNYFDINRLEIGERKDVPHNIKIEFEYNNRTFVEDFIMDTLDTYITNINTSFSKSTVDVGDKLLLEDWMS